MWVYKKLVLAIIAFFVLATLQNVNSVWASNELWSQTYGGPEYDCARSVAATSDGGYILAGVSNSFGGFWVVKTDSDGNMEWNRTYQGSISSLIATCDGGYALCGDVLSNNESHRDFLLIKTDSRGNVIWNKTYDGTSFEYAYSLVEASDGGYMLVGRTSSAERSDNFWAVKTDGHGEIEWNQTYGGPSDERAFSLVATYDGGYAITGWTQSYWGMVTNFWLVKTDPNGNMQWNQTYKGDESRNYAIIQTADEGYMIAVGNSLIKTDANGNMEWNQTYNNSVYSLIERPDGGYSLVGDSQLIKTDAYGNSEWTQTYNGSLFALTENTDGGYVITGQKSSNFWLARTDEYGIIPEFQSWTILPFLLTAFVVSIFCKQKLVKHRKRG